MKKKEQKNIVTESKVAVPIDKPVFWGALLVILLVCLTCIILPTQANKIASLARNWVLNTWDWFFLIFGLATLIISIVIALSKFGNIRLGGKDAKPDYKFSSWLAMIFFSAIGSSSILWAVCEPMAYLQSPPFGYEPFSPQAYNISIAYGMFHWGPIAWAFYALPSLPVAYYFLVKKRKNLKLSQVCGDLIGEKHANGVLGKIIDIFTVFATFGGNGPGLGFGVPLLATLICAVFGFTRNQWLDMAVLIIWAAIFSISVYRGLNKGIKILSDINMYLVLLLLAFVFIVSDPLYILRSSVESIGTLASNFIHMSTYSDVIGGGTFARDWTVFYWAWWVALTPFMAIFVARISKGQTIRELLLGIIGAGSIGTGSLFMVLGSYTVKIQSSGVLDVAKIYSEQGTAAAVMETIMTLPFAKIVAVILILVYFIFMATCIDSGAFAMGCIASKEMTDDQQPTKWNRFTWAIAIAMLGVAILRLGGGLEAIQTSVIVVGLPAAFLTILLYCVLFKWLKKDCRKLKEEALLVIDIDKDGNSHIIEGTDENCKGKKENTKSSDAIIIPESDS